LNKLINLDINEELVLSNTRYIYQKEYWLNKLIGDISETNFYILKDNKSSENKSKGSEEITFSHQLSNGIIKLGFDTDITIYIILLAGLKALLYRYTNREDISVVSPVFAPTISDYTLNSRLYIRDTITASTTFKECLLEVRQTVLDAYENQDYPFEKILEFLFDEPKNEKRGQITDIGCLLRNIHENTDIEELKCNLVFSFKREQNGLKGSIIYDSEFYNRDSIERLSCHYIELLGNVLENKDVKVSQLTILSEPEKKLLLSDFNDNKNEFPKEKSIISYFEDNVKSFPEAEAIIYEGESWTYRHLNETSNHLSRYLKKMGVGTDHLIGILMKRSPWMAVGILAVWKAGGAYIPLDPQTPVSRITHILKDSGVRILLTNEQYKATNPQLQNNYHGELLELDSQYNKSSIAESEDYYKNLDIKIHMDSLAYIIYTSGSTGKPKGAMVEHIGMINHINTKISDLQVTGKSIVAQNASHTFDISVWQFFTALICGGKTIIYPEEVILNPKLFISYIIKDKVTILEVVPSYLSVILDFITETETVPLPLEYLLVTGEEVKPHLVTNWFKKYPHIKIVNAYGPTEASDDITHHIMDKHPEVNHIPIGRPVQNMSIYIVDNNMQLCPVGVMGEIVVSGIGVGRGYLNDIEKTNRAFIKNPFSDEVNRIYRTGDLGRWFPEGVIEFLGRKDYQVKIRGYRIELEEIERHIISYKGVKEVVVVDKKDDQDGKYLCAYITAHKKVDIMLLKENLEKHLPEYMVPAFFIQLEKIPLTSNGKIDRKALPEPTQGEKATILYLTKEMIEKLKTPSINKNLLLVPKDREKFFKSIQSDMEKERFIAKEQSKKTGIKYYPLSQAQKMMYYTDIKYPGTGSNNLCGTKRYTEIIDKELLEKAINIILYRNPGLRLRFVEIDYESSTQPLQYFSKYVEQSIDSIDFSEGKDAKIFKEWTEANAAEPFQLLESDLYYFAYIKINDKESGYYTKIHHLISDGWTFSLLVEEIDKIYKDLKEKQPISQKPNPSYLIYIFDEQEYLKSSRAQEDIEYWYNALYPFPQSWTLYDKIGDVSNIEAKTISLPFPEELSRKIINFCEVSDSSLFKIVLAAFSLYISNVNQLDDFIIGIVTHGRTQKYHRKIAGHFTNFLPIRIKIEKNISFETFVNESCVSMLYENLLHQKLPYSILSSKLMELTGSDIGDFMEVNILDQPTLYEGEAKIKRHFAGHNPIPLSININRLNNKINDLIEISWTFQTECFTEKQIQKIHRGLIKILTEGLNNTGRKISEIQVLDEGEKEHEIFDINGNKIDIRQVEKILMEYRYIDNAAVVLRNEKTGKPEFWAYITAQENLQEPELKNYLSKLLPSYLIPSFFVQLEEMPLIAKGKANKALLSEIKVDKDQEFICPKNDLEEKLVEIYHEILGIDKIKISTEANFFDLGGHSLKAVVLAERIHKILNIKIPLTQIFDTPQISKLADFITKSSEYKFISIKPVEKKEYYFLSQAQKRLYIINQVEGPNTNYNVTMAATLTGKLNLDLVKKIFKNLTKRHESFRTFFKIIKEEEPIQIINDEANLDIEYLALSQYKKENETEHGTVKKIVENFIRPFDLSQAPLSRLGLIKCGNTKHVMIFDMHHIVTDGVSISLLINELMDSYSMKTLPRLKLQYKDYSELQDRLFKSEEIKKQEEYWLDRFKGEIPILDLATDFPRPPVQDLYGRTIYFPIDEALMKLLKKLTTSHKVTNYMVLLAVFNILLYKYTGQTDIIAGTPLTGRNHADLEQIIGFFINVLVMRNSPTEDKTFLEFLEEVKMNSLQAFENRDYPFDNLLENLNLKRDNSRNPLYEVVFASLNIEVQPIEIMGLKLEPFEFENKTSKTDLRLAINEQGTKIEMSLTYATALFKHKTAEKMTQHYIEILRQVLENNNIKLRDIKVSLGLSAAKPLTSRNSRGLEAYAENNCRDDNEFEF